MSRTGFIARHPNLLLAASAALPLIAAGAATVRAEDGTGCVYCVSLGDEVFCVERKCPPLTWCHPRMRITELSIEIWIECGAIA